MADTVTLRPTSSRDRDSTKMIPIEAENLPQAWRASLAAMIHADDLARIDSARGPCVEARDVVIRVGEPTAEPMIDDMYPTELHPVVDAYAAAFLGSSEVKDATVRERLYRWPAQGSDQVIDQVTRAEKHLRESPNSRFTILGLWDPSVDPALANPVSPLVASFRVHGSTLTGTLVARSVDAWLGAFPMFVGFASLMQNLSERAEFTAGAATYFFLSYHLYDIDLPVVAALTDE